MLPLCPVCGLEVAADAVACPRDGTPLAMDEREPTVRRDLLLGAKLGEYVVSRRIGHGGMGIVYEAHQPEIGKRVAIKVLRPELGASREQLLKEARTTNRVQHRAVVDIFSFGVVPDGRHYFVMEYLNGSPLDQVITLRAPLDSKEAIEILDQLLEGLAAIHRVGVIHRDLKPSNVFLGPGSPPQVKILDFGLAKQGKLDGSSIDVYASGIVGTPDFMAPEQATGEALGRHTDLYAVGVIAFEMLTGRLPFVRPNTFDLLKAHMSEPAPSPSSFNRDLPRAWDALLAKLLAKTPKARPPTAEAVRAELRRIQGSFHSGETVPDTGPPERLTLPNLTGAQPSTDRISRHFKGPLLALVLLGVAVAGAVGAFAYGTAGHPGPNAASESIPWRPPPEPPPLPPVVTVPGRPPEPISPATPPLAPPAPAPVRRAPHRAAAAAAAPPVPRLGTARFVIPGGARIGWADVSVDGHRLGRTPCGIELTEGTHQLRVVNGPAKIDLSADFQVSGGRTALPLERMLQGP